MRFLFAENAFMKCMKDAADSIEVSSGLPLKERSTVLRGGLMLVVSAFDFLVHEIVRIEILHRVKCNSPDISIKLPYSCFIQSSDGAEKEIDVYVRRVNSYKSFVGSSSIKECFNSISINIWQEVEKSSGRDAKKTKKRLDDIWKWRNRIAHEGDMVPSNMTFSYWPIYKDDVIEACDFLKDLAYDLLNTVRSLSSSQTDPPRPSG